MNGLEKKLKQFSSTLVLFIIETILTTYGARKRMQINSVCVLLLINLYAFFAARIWNNKLSLANGHLSEDF